MTTSEKLKAKRLRKLYSKLGRISMIFFAIMLMGAIIIRCMFDGIPSVSAMIIGLISVLSPLFAGPFFMLIAAAYDANLRNYEISLLQKRAVNFALNTIEYLEKGETENAVNEYKKCKNYVNRSLGDYLFGMLVMACKLSNNEKLIKKGNNKIIHTKTWIKSLSNN